MAKRHQCAPRRHRFLFSSKCHRPVCFILAAAMLAPLTAFADEGGVSFWLPGLLGDPLVATPGQPGFSFLTFNYYTNVSAGGDVARAREFEIGAISRTVKASVFGSLHADSDFEWLQGTYVFSEPLLGARASVNLASIVGYARAGVDGTLMITSPINATIPLNRTDSATGFGDLYPAVMLKWNHGIDNFMVYVTGDIPVGDYNSKSLANLGIGHGAFDSGAGYTYFDEKKGYEFSIVGGFTYNFENPATDYQNGVDLHIDWEASQFLSKQFALGVVGYLYQEIGCDSGSGNRVGCFQSRVVGLGPQMTYLFPVGDMQGDLNLKAYGEFNAQHRPDGWNAWLTFSISPAALTTTAKAPQSYK